MQYNKLDPQIPDRLQQFPNAEPLQVDFRSAPHLRSVLTLSFAGEEVAAGADEVRVLVVEARMLVLVLVVTGRVDVVRLRAVDDVAIVVGAALDAGGAALGDDEPDPGHLPNSGLQPAPQ